MLDSIHVRTYNALQLAMYWAAIPQTSQNADAHPCLLQKTSTLSMREPQLYHGVKEESGLV